MSEHVNINRIQETSGGDTEFERELIEMYLEDAGQHLENIKLRLGKQDFKAIRQSAHTLKGSSANIGALSLERVAFEIERAAMNDDTPRLSALLPELEENYAGTQQQYRRYVATIS